MYKPIERIAHLISERLYEKIPIRILELGAGRGDLFERINHPDVHYYAIEPNEYFYLLNVSKYGHLPNFNIVNLEFDSRQAYMGMPTFDLVVSRKTLDRYDKFDVREILEYIRLAARPDASILIVSSIFFYRWFKRELNAHVVYLPLCALLETDLNRWRSSAVAADSLVK